MTGQRGRPRSSLAHSSILEATRDLLTAAGYERLTIEAVAVRAAVGKQTIYRWWPSKAAIVAEAVLAGVITGADPVVRDTGDLAADLREWLRAGVATLDDPQATALTRALIVASVERETDAARLYQHAVAPLRRHLMARLQQAVEHGQLRAGVDLEPVADALMGASLYRILARSGPTADSYADALVDVVFQGICPTRERIH